MVGVKVAGSSLIEVIIASVIITAVFVLASLIFINVTRTSAGTVKLRAALIIEDLSIKTKESKEFVSKSYAFDNIIVERSIDAYEGVPGLVQIKFQARTVGNDFILERKELVYVE
ncbi:hypothetical protein LVD17_19060 [Fulvivirga ulvae]|uniref:type IV pilus modification PilV family protein n=1 Tax=Fulvivirga ulvae TaxID=2904245 RepID=UPI001F3852AD|nr:hypothetical protein [Fulvivirga ulvae]UII30394.1 hypothetical protein LVD17_19060 [Fulvivirga ulvae]